jgi:hypothetical protein
MGRVTQRTQTTELIMAKRTYARAMGVDEKTGERATIDAPFGNALLELARRRSDVVGLTADLGKIGP